MKFSSSLDFQRGIVFFKFLWEFLHFKEELSFTRVYSLVAEIPLIQVLDKIRVIEKFRSGLKTAFIARFNKAGAEGNKFSTTLSMFLLGLQVFNVSSV